MNQGGVAADQLRALVERIERLEAEKADLADDIKDVYAEAKANGYDTKVLRQVVRLRAMDAAERQEHEALLELYMHALGMVVAERIARTEVETGQTDIEAACAAADPTVGGSFEVRVEDAVTKAFAGKPGVTVTARGGRKLVDNPPDGDSDEARRARMAAKPSFADGDPEIPEFLDRRKQAAKRAREEASA